MALAKRAAALHRQARALGLFVPDRELLACPGCGLTEDVDCNGCLISYIGNGPIEDTGLRFQKLHNGHYRCPACCEEQ